MGYGGGRGGEEQKEGRKLKVQQCKQVQVLVEQATSQKPQGRPWSKLPSLVAAGGAQRGPGERFVGGRRNGSEGFAVSLNYLLSRAQSVCNLQQHFGFGP